MAKEQELPPHAAAPAAPEPGRPCWPSEPAHGQKAKGLWAPAGRTPQPHLAQERTSPSSRPNSSNFWLSSAWSCREPETKYKRSTSKQEEETRRGRRTARPLQRARPRPVSWRHKLPPCVARGTRYLQASCRAHNRRSASTTLPLHPPNHPPLHSGADPQPHHFRRCPSCRQRPWPRRRPLPLLSLLLLLPLLHWSC